MVEVNAKFPHTKLVILGGGDLKEEFLQKAKKANVEENFYLPGFQTVDQIIAWARLCKGMLATHAGFSLIELGAIGLPVIAYDYEWHSEMVENGKSGLLVPFRDAKAMGKAVIEVLEKPELRNQFSKILKQRVHQIYHPDIVQQRMRDYFSLMI